MSDIVEFLTAQLDEDEAAAVAASGRDPQWWDTGPGYPEAPEVRVVNDRDDVIVSEVGERVARHIARYDPARVLAEVASKRAILDEHKHVPAVQQERDHEHEFGCQTCHADTHCGETMALGWCETVRLLAAPYDQHPDYDPAWRLT